MADPVSTTASQLAIAEAALQSTKLLYEVVDRYRGRDKTLQRLQVGLEAMIKILGSLNAVIATEEPILTLLKGPVQRCSQICHDFMLSMETFSGVSKTSVLDWAKVEFMGGDINEFIGTLAGYKSTISVGLGSITMRTSKVTRSVVEHYTEMIKDTTYDLQLHLQRIDEKMTQLSADRKTSHDIRVELNNEKEVTRQCLHVCEEATTYLQNLSIETAPMSYEASDISCQRIYRVGEAIADDKSDQVVVTTTADLFDVRKAVSKNSSAQLVACLTKEDLRHLTEKRYSSRFGAMANTSDSVEVRNAGWQSTSEPGQAKRASHRATHSEASSGLKSEKSKPASNEIRKRRSGGAEDE